MGLTFSLKKAPGTVYFWEKNDWRRKHGYNLPISPYLIMQWVCLILFDIAFFCFLVHFIPVYEYSTVGTTSESFEILYQEWKQQELPFVDPFSTWSCKIMIGLGTLVKILSVTTSMIETEDPTVTSQSDTVTRSQTYTRKYGIPVIDSYSGICNICRVKVSKQTRHCKLCNKCIDKMDHHCKWLNCCIGKSNYRLFLALVVSAFFALLWYSYIALSVAWTCYYDKNTFMIHVFQLFKGSNYQLATDQLYFTCTAMTIFIAILATISFVAITRLLVFHVKIASMKMTTIEYLNISARNNDHSNSLFDSDDEDYYSDSDLSDDNFGTTHKQSHYHQQQWPGYRHIRLVTHKMRRTWILIARTFVPNYKYRRLTNSNQKCHCCFFTIKRPQLLPTTSRRNYRNKRDSNTRDNVNMEEFFATKTIRPIVNLDDFNQDGVGPNYDDDMGLDLTVLDGFSDDEEEKVAKKMTPNRSSKAARLLDLSEEEMQRHQQQQQ